MILPVLLAAVYSLYNLPPAFRWEHLADPERFGVFYLPHTFAEEVFDFQGAANQLAGRVAPGANLDEILRQAEVRLESYGVFDTTPLKQQASNQFLTGEIDGLGAVATVVPTIFLAVQVLTFSTKRQ